MVTVTSRNAVVVVVDAVVVAVVVGRRVVVDDAVVVMRVVVVVVVAVVVVVVVVLSRTEVVVDGTVGSGEGVGCSAPQPTKHNTITQQRNRQKRFIHTPYFMPVEPKPPSPRRVSLRLSACS